jgi:hypothetical protein
MADTIWTVAVLMLGLALMVPLINGAFSAGAVPAVANETATIDFNTNYTLGEQDVTRYNDLDIDANGSQLENGTDYIFRPDDGNGTVDWQNTAAISSGDTATVNYSFAAHDQTTETQRDIIGLFGPWIGLFALVAAAFTITRWLGGSF